MSVSDLAASDIVETVPSALLILDRNLNISSANRAFYQTFRTSPDETEGCLIYDLGNRQWDIPALRTLLESVIPHRASVEGFEVEHDFPTIGRRTMLVNARKIFRPGEHDGFILLAIEDVSEERAARKESNRNWQLTQSIVDTIRDPLVVLENDMTIVTASKAFLTMFGITQAEAHGRRVSELGQHQWDVPALRNLLDKVLPENKPIESFEIEDNFPGLGRRVFNLNARKIMQPGNHAHRMLLVFEDITDRKQRERDAELLTNEISHRIKNNLQVVVGLIAYEIKSTSAASVPGLKAMQARIGAIAQLYDLISQSSRSGSIAVDAYLGEIAKQMSASLIGSIGLVVTFWPHVWAGIFTDNESVLAHASQYFLWVGPCYGFFAVGLCLYFASQGAGKMLGPVLAGTLRLAIVTSGGIWLTQHQGTAFQMYGLIAFGMVSYGLATAWAVYKVSWARALS